MLARQKSAFALKILATMVKVEVHPITKLVAVSVCQIQESCLRDALLDFLSRAEENTDRYDLAMLSGESNVLITYI